MQLTIILDKSAFQSFSYKELYRLCQYYKVIVPPILVTEILGDLSKEVKEGNPPSEARVIGFAKKLFVDESVVIMDYRKIVHLDLMLHNIPLDRRPIVNIAQKSKMGSQSGFEIKESEEEKSINKWKQGEFTDAERELSKKWRSTTTEPNALDRLKTKFNHSKYGLKTLDEVLLKVDSILNDKNITQLLLICLCENYEIPAYDTVSILQDWKQKGQPNLKNYSKYAFHCLRVDLLFIIGLTESIIGTRSTNSIDLKYLYYLPFTKIFSSGDNLHKQLIPSLIDEDQIFIEAHTLKGDIASMIGYIENLEVSERKQYYTKPPIDEKYFTFRMWRDFYGYTLKNALWQIPHTSEEIENAKVHAEKIMKSFKENIDNDANVEDADYIVRHSVIRGDDPCYCKSGSPLVGCCMTPEQFKTESELSWLSDLLEGKIQMEEGLPTPSREEIEMRINILKESRNKKNPK